ncbi:MAG: hypothetical protein JST92_01925 [Deltaproteobacteria bacterium]|nr:hypothetical protein [Deltaproteobacteria bacterium]
MTTQADVRKIALSFPGTSESRERFAFSVRDGEKDKGFAWAWNERVDPKKARVPNAKVLALRTSGLDEKEALLAMAPGKFFTEPHYNGYPAVLLHLPKVGVAELRMHLVNAWRCMAPLVQTCRAKVLNGHKGCAAMLPFEPEKVWLTKAAPIAPGRRGHAVRGTINRKRFESFVVGRSKKHFVLLDEATLKSARAKEGDLVNLSLEPR